MPVIVLDPVNLPVMQAARERGIKDFIGGNCTVSLMLMAVGGLMRAGVVEWITAMTYQSASGAGAQNMRELLEQMGALHRVGGVVACKIPPRASSTSTERSARAFSARGISRVRTSACRWRRSLIPWIDKDLGNGQSREEWKAGAEANKILGTEARAHPGRGNLRAGGRDALPFAGARPSSSGTICRSRRSSG